jgi:hypothetical protein
MDPKRFFAQLDSDIRKQNETIAKARQLLESCDPELLFAIDPSEMPEPAARTLDPAPMGAIRG